MAKPAPVNRFNHNFVRFDVRSREYVESACYSKATGEKLLRAPVDVAELLKSGEYSLEPPAPAPVSEPAPPVEVHEKRSPGRPRKAEAA